MLVAPSILDADFLRLGDELRRLQAAGADWIHLDVMDGHFVPNLSFGVPILKRVRTATPLPIDSHLMVTEPEKLIERFLPDSDQIVFHLEATRVPAECIDLIRKASKKAGIAMNPDTPITRIAPWLNRIDAVLLMSVFPGFGGQKFIPETLDKIRTLRELVDRDERDVAIWVDGGISPELSEPLASAGADVIVAGSAITRAADYGAVIAKLKGSRQ